MSSVPRVANPQQAASAKQTIGKLRIRLNRARNLKGPEILGMSNCLVVFTFEGKREESSVKVNDIAPVWNEEITFEQVAYPPTSKVAITIVYRSGKKDEVLGVAAPGQNLWTTGVAPPTDRWLPIATKEGIYAGELNFHIHWTKTEVKYRAPVTWLQNAVKKTQTLTKRADPLLEKALLASASLTTYAKGKYSGLNRFHKGLGAAALVALFAFLTAVVAIPAIIFFPVTFVVAGGLFLAALVAAPVVLVLGWLFVCSAPVQAKLVGPSVERLLQVDVLKKMLTVD